jgi:hypothetical protein
VQERISKFAADSSITMQEKGCGKQSHLGVPLDIPSYELQRPVQLHSGLALSDEALRFACLVIEE